jgi:hypothetical protein
LSLPFGTHRLGAADGNLVVRTARAGLASRAGHDLVLAVGCWSAVLAIEPGGGALSLAAGADALEVREAAGGARPVTEGDRRQIHRNIAEKVLDARRHPEIAFTSTSVEPDGEAALTVEGDLRVAGVTRPVRFGLKLEAGTVRGTVAVDQSAFGIRPFTALMGTLRVADRVEIAVQARLPGV